jgi:C_GCAxxG_C_C family probable redox protein
MSSSQQVVEKAIKHYQSGYNCAESVLLALFEHIEPDSKNELVPKISAGFGGGIGRCGSVCGALTGAIMAVGIKYASNETAVEKRAKAYAYAKTLLKTFEEQNGTTFCRDLIKYDLSNNEEVAKFRQEGIPQKVCSKLIKSSIENYLALDTR